MRGRMIPCRCRAAWSAICCISRAAFRPCRCRSAWRSRPWPPPRRLPRAAALDHHLHQGLCADGARVSGVPARLCQTPLAAPLRIPASNATVIIERDYHGEPGLFSISIKEPARQSLRDIGRQLEHASTAPVEAIKDFRRTIQFTRLPPPLRRAFWWLCLNIGRQRGNYFGTFGVSVYSALQAESLHPLSPLTTLLNYGVMSSDGVLDVRIIYDHRVMDGATVARALARLEKILNRRSRTKWRE